MNWFGVKLLLKAINKDKKTMLAEESIRLIQATDAKEAEDIACQLKDKDLNDGFNVKGIPCTWEVDEVLDVFQMYDEPTNTTEVYSLILQPNEARALKAIYDITL